MNEVISSNESRITVFTLIKYTYVCTRKQSDTQCEYLHFFLFRSSGPGDILTHGDENELRFFPSSECTRTVLEISQGKNMRAYARL